MKFNKINLNRTPLSADDISAAMDFDGLLNNPPAASSTPSSPTTGAGKLIKLIGYGIGVAAVAVVGWLFMNRQQENTTNVENEHNAPVHLVEDDSENSDKDTPLINPPLADVEIPFESATVSADDNSEVKLGSSMIKVPKDCFVNKDGTPVTGEVELQYREFNNNLDIFLSGIPMQYDSAGVNYTFESNGMFELRGYQNGEPVEVAPEKELEIAMEIAEKKPGFSEYYLNEETGAWEFKNGQNYEMEVVEDVLEDSHGDEPSVRNEALFSTEAELSIQQSAVEITKTQELTAQIDNQIQQVEKEKKQLSKPVKPKKADPEIPQLALEVDFNDFPELKGFSNTLFQVAEKDLDSFDAKWGEETWNDISVSKSSLPGNYRMIFSRPGKRVRVTCSPVVSEADLPNAMAIYDDLFEKYETAVDSLDQVKKQKEKERKEAIKKAREEAIEQARLAAEQRREAQLSAIKQTEQTRKKQVKINSANNKLTALFRANQFGYYNCDSPMGRIGGAQNIIASYETDSESKIYMVNMVEKGRRAVLTRYQNQSGQFNPKRENTFFAVTDNGTLAVGEVKPGEVEGKKSCVIKMKECDEELNTRKKVEDYLETQGIVL